MSASVLVYSGLRYDAAVPLSVGSSADTSWDEYWFPASTASLAVVVLFSIQAELHSVVACCVIQCSKGASEVTAAAMQRESERAQEWENREIQRFRWRKSVWEHPELPLLFIAKLYSTAWDALPPPTYRQTDQPTHTTTRFHKIISHAVSRDLLHTAHAHQEKYVWMNTFRVQGSLFCNQCQFLLPSGALQKCILFITVSISDVHRSWMLGEWRLHLTS